MQNSWGYVALCLVVPLVWGIVSARVFDRLQARRQKRGLPAPSPDDNEMYYI